MRLAQLVAIVFGAGCSSNGPSNANAERTASLAAPSSVVSSAIPSSVVSSAIPSNAVSGAIASAQANPPLCLGARVCSESDPAVERAPFRHRRTALTIQLGPPQHRGRDLVFRVGEPQWVAAKFAYGPTDKDLEDEDVDIFVDRGCAGTWTKLATARTKKDEARLDPPYASARDAGGRVEHLVPSGSALPIGHHRVRFVVRGDGTETESFLAVVPDHHPIVVSDVDGTLTESEFAEVEELAKGTQAAAQPHAPELLRTLAKRGLLPIYITARPEWLTARTREFLTTRGFPPGIVHTTLTKTGRLGGEAAAFKTGELAEIAKSGTIAWAIGNQPSDVEAYASLTGATRIFLALDGDLRGGRKVNSYAEVLPEAEKTPSVCP